jgi:hypothetical protein
MKYKIRFYYQQAGGHTHMRVFSGRNIENSTLGKAGDLCMTNEEFESFMDGTAVVEFESNKNTIRDAHTTAVPQGGR